MPQVNLSKTPIVNLTKGQVVNLTKDGTSKTSGLINVFFGAKWGQIQHKGFLGFGKSYESVDLDATLILYDSSYYCKYIRDIDMFLSYLNYIRFLIGLSLI